MKNFLFNIFFIIVFVSPLHAQNADEFEAEIVSSINDLQKTNIDSNKIEIYYTICKLYQKVDIKKSNDYANRLFEFTKKRNLKKGFGYFYLIKSYNLVYQGNYEKAIIAANKAAVVFKNNLNKELYLEANYYKVVSYYFLGNHTLSNQIAFKAIHESKNINVPKQIGLFYDFIGANYSSLNNLFLAITNLERAVSYFNLVNYKKGLVNTYNQIAEIYLKTNQVSAALEYSNKAIHIAKSITDIDEQSIAILYLFNASINLKLNNNKNVIDILAKAYLILKKGTNKSLFTSYYLVNAKLLFKKKKFNEALLYCKKAQKVDTNVEFSGIQIQYLKAQCYHKLNQYAVAKAIFLDIEQKIKSNKLSYIGIDNADFYKDFAQNEKFDGNLDKAYVYLQQSNKWLNIKTTQIIKDELLFLSTKYDVNQKKIELQNSLIEKQKIALELNNQKKSRYILILLIALLSTMTWFVYFQFKEQKKFNVLLSKKNRIIEKKSKNLENSNVLINQSLKTKEILLREIHHRVKNNLQLVMSLLRNQARSEEQNDIHTFIEKSQSRIESIALIHQNLYQSKYVDNVDMQEYTLSLCDSILNTCCDDTKNINVQVNIHEVILDLSIAISIGLIINELVVNAIKHAFHSKSSGSITVNLVERTAGNYELHVQDNGIGFDFHNYTKNTFGKVLVELCAQQLNGTLICNNVQGTAVILLFTA